MLYIFEASFFKSQANLLYLIQILFDLFPYSPQKLSFPSVFYFISNLETSRLTACFVLGCFSSSLFLHQYYYYSLLPYLSLSYLHFRFKTTPRFTFFISYISSIELVVIYFMLGWVISKMQQH